MSLTNMVAEGDIYDIEEATEDALRNSEPLEVLEALIAGLHLAGEWFKKGDLFVVDMMIVTETFSSAMKIVEPALGEMKREYIGKVVLGTVQGDIHDIGKNLVAVFMKGAGFEVIDLGIDVSPEKFVEAVKKHQPQIVAMSALLTTTMLKMEDNIKAIEEAGQRDKVSILVGGAPVSKRFAQSIKADGFANNAPEAVDKAITFLK